MINLAAMERTIRLNYKREFFEEIYFVNNNASYWKSPSLGRTPKLIIISGALLIGAVIYVALSSPEGKPSSTQLGIVGAGAIIFVLSLSAYIRKCGVIRQWLKGIQLYLADLEKFKVLEMIITDKNFLFIKDDSQTVLKWEDIQTLETTKEYFLLKGEQSFFIPRKCLSKSDSKYCEDILPKKIG